MEIATLSLIVLGIIATFSLFIVYSLSRIIKEITESNNDKVHSILELLTDGILAKNLEEFATLRENVKLEKALEITEKFNQQENVRPVFIPKQKRKSEPKPSIETLENEIFN